MAGLITEWLARADARGLLTSSNNSWLVEQRKVAAAQLEQLNSPNRKLESWRYSDANRLTKDLQEVGEYEAEIPTTIDDSDAVVIVVDETGYKGIGECPDWLSITTLADMQASDWEAVNFDQESVVNLANSVLVETAALIKVQASEQPIHLHLIYAFDELNEWQYLRNQFQVATGADVQITEQLQSGRINVVNVFSADADVNLHRNQIIELNPTEQFVSYNQFNLAENVKVSSMNHHNSGSLQHHNHTVNFNETGSSYLSGSVNKTFNHSHITDVVNVNHHCKNNQSDVTHRSIAKDQSQIYNNAKAMVAVGADGSEIEQDLKNILLSPDAKIFSKPELEVYADEVVAAHGSTIGALDDKALFYLQSRGVDIEQARDIMIESFVEEAVIESVVVTNDQTSESE